MRIEATPVYPALKASTVNALPRSPFWAGPASVRETVWIGSAEGNAGATLMLTCQRNRHPGRLSL